MPILAPYASLESSVINEKSRNFSNIPLPYKSPSILNLTSESFKIPIPSHQRIQQLSKMEFRVCRQPFNQVAFNKFDHVFGINPTFGSCYPRCCQSGRHQPIQAYPSQSRIAMNQLIEDAKRQVELEHSSGAISGYFAAMDSIMNAFHKQQNSVKRTENDEEETTDTLEDVFEAAFKELTKNSEKSQPEGQENDELEKLSENPDTKKEHQVKDEQTIQATSKPARLSTKVQVNEDLEKLQIEIEFSGYQFKSEHLDVKLENENTLVISAKDGQQNFERKFKLASNCQMDKIIPKFKDDENKQILRITIPKEVKKTLKIPISSTLGN